MKNVMLNMDIKMLNIDIMMLDMDIMMLDINGHNDDMNIGMLFLWQE